MAFNPKARALRISASLPNTDDFLDLDAYNKLFKQMIAVQVDSSGNEVVPGQKAKMEDAHRTVVAGAISAHIERLTLERAGKK